MNTELLNAMKMFEEAGKYAKAFECLARLYEEDKESAIKLVAPFRQKLTDLVASGQDVRNNYGTLKKTYLLTAQDILDDFLIYIEWERDSDKKFYLPRRKQLKVVVDALQDLADDKLDLLTISMPPGVGKSATAIFALAWFGGRKPNESILGGSHNTAFLRGVYDELNRILQEDGEYLWREVFPAVPVVRTNAQDMLIDLDKSKRFTTFEFTSIGAGNAGKVRATQLLYCDDLCSGIEEAMSKDRLDTLWTKYTTDLKQRKMGKCKELHIATRWSVHDVIGRLEREHAGDPRARFIAIPAINEEGQSNFNYAGGIGFDTKFFEEMKNSLDDVSWRALYMNQPIEREGLLYDSETLRRFYRLPEGDPDAILSICDTAEGGGDDTFLPVFAVYGNDHYCIDCVCSDSLPEVTDAMCAEILLKHKVKMCQFESNAAGGRTADKIEDMVKSKGGHTHITKKRTTTNKETKIIVNSPFIKENVLFLDEKSIEKGSMYAKMMRNLCSYTVSGKNKHDDVPDGFAQYALFVQNLGANTVQIVRRPF